jgi:hypothetical protein
MRRLSVLLLSAVAIVLAWLLFTETRSDAAPWEVSSGGSGAAEVPVPLDGLLAQPGGSRELVSSLPIAPPPRTRDVAGSRSGLVTFGSDPILARLSGEVVDDGGAPIEGALVAVGWVGRRQLLTTDAQGTFTALLEWDAWIEGVPAARVQASKEGFQSKECQVSLAESMWGQEGARYKLTLERGGAVTGRVVHAGLPIARACVDVFHQGGYRRYWTDCEGRFLAAAAPSEGVIGRVAAFFGAIGAGEKYVHARPQSITDIGDIELVQVSVLACQVVFSDGQPVAGVRVDGVRSDAQSPVQGAMLGAQYCETCASESGHVTLYGMQNASIDIRLPTRIPASRNEVIGRVVPDSSAHVFAIRDVGARVVCQHKGKALPSNYVTVWWQQIVGGQPSGRRIMMSAGEACLLERGSRWLVSVETGDGKGRGAAEVSCSDGRNWIQVVVEVTVIE